MVSRVVVTLRAWEDRAVGYRQSRNMFETSENITLQYIFQYAKLYKSYFHIWIFFSLWLVKCTRNYCLVINSLALLMLLSNSMLWGTLNVNQATFVDLPCDSQHHPDNRCEMECSTWQNYCVLYFSTQQHTMGHPRAAAITVFVFIV